MIYFVLVISAQFAQFLTFTLVDGVQCIRQKELPSGIIQHNLWTKTKRGSSTRDSEKGSNN